MMSGCGTSGRMNSGPIYPTIPIAFVFSCLANAAVGIAAATGVRPMRERKRRRFIAIS